MGVLGGGGAEEGRGSKGLQELGWGVGAAQEGGKDHGSLLGLARDHQSDLIDLRSNPGQADHCHLDTDVCSGPSAVVGAGKLGGEPGVGCGLGGGREALTQPEGVGLQQMF